MPAYQSRMVRVAVGACLAATAIATPTPVEREAVTPAAVLERAASSTPITNQNQLDQAFSSVPADVESIAAGVSVLEAIFTNIVPAPGPTAVAQLQQELKTIYSANPQDIFKSGADILLAGLAGGDYEDLVEAFTVENNASNVNPVVPGIYDISGDAPYDISEDQLRQVIYIPPEYTYGKEPPVIFLPGTAVLAGTNFGPNYGKLFKQNHIADPVYLNLPGMNLADIQGAAEYVAYAVTTISWSAGSVDAQWALKYWPSIRPKYDNKISISADYHGTILAQSLCPGTVTLGSDPAICQQRYNSTFIRTLRNNGGDSAYIPSTNVYSIFDEIVQPQEDPNASGFLNDARGVGVTNVELQSVCGAVLPGGAFYNTHEGVLYNALAYALAVDAIQNGGPGQLSRVNPALQCAQFATPGLSLADILATEANIPIAVAAVIAFEPKTADEPPIKAYAQKDTPT
ncbi:hypothetical protein DOTSEDRAFT_56045 [Dothistroma septosporum NZE10]|uniref:Uncharacterized protein n=1 Tax=Dothistroma septosporum (strain NZE10 / CBS 128990) TaxID=675120 RepID=N1PHF7_DOTSN|nr:hypothetical protein DOTSEDRAFT_56045 [Dothistroma septosporum NZE10]